MEQNNTGPLAGKSFCTSGFRFTPREAAHIAALGGRIHEGVGKSTTYLVVLEQPPLIGQVAAKIRKARQHSAEIITRDKALEMLPECAA